MDVEVGIGRPWIWVFGSFDLKMGVFVLFSYALGAHLVLYHLEVAIGRSQCSSPCFFCKTGLLYLRYVNGSYVVFL